MIFQELIDNNIGSLEVILNKVVEFYPEQRVNLDGYAQVLQTLFVIEKHENEDDNIAIAIRHIKEDDEDWHNVYGYNHCEETWALELCSWSEWLGFWVDPKSLEIYGEIAFIAHCLYEMTWCGFTEDKIEEERQKLHEAIEEVESGEAELISWEDVKKNLNLDDEEID